MVTAVFNDSWQQRNRSAVTCPQCHSGLYICTFDFQSTWRCVDCHINFQHELPAITLKEK